MSYDDDDIDDQPDNPQDYFHNDYGSKKNNSDYQSDNPQSYFSDER